MVKLCVFTHKMCNVNKCRTKILQSFPERIKNKKHKKNLPHYSPSWEEMKHIDRRILVFIVNFSIPANVAVVAATNGILVPMPKMGKSRDTN